MIDRHTPTMTLLTRGLGAAAVAGATVLGAAGLGFGGPAAADPPQLNGTFVGGDDEMVWTISSNCVEGRCTATVASNQGWTKVATYHGGRYHFIVTKPDGAVCDDGSYAPAYITISLDPITLQGTVASDSNYGCPGGHISEQPFQLRRIG